MAVHYDVTAASAHAGAATAVAVAAAVDADAAAGAATAVAVAAAVDADAAAVKWVSGLGTQTVRFCTAKLGQGWRRRNNCPPK